MDWFSKNFPSLAKLVSILGNTTQRRPRPRTRGPARRVATPTTDGSQEAAEFGTLNLDQPPQLVTEEANLDQTPELVTPELVTEEADQGAPVLTEESSFDAAPSEIEEGAVIEGPEEADSPAFCRGMGKSTSHRGGIGDQAIGP